MPRPGAARRRGRSGSQQWYCGEIRGRNLGLNAMAGKPREYFNIDASRYDEMRPGRYDVHERVRDTSAGGQLAGLNFPNWTGFSGQVLNHGPDRELNLIMIQAYNDWHVDEWCGQYPDRFIRCGVLPLFDVDRAVAELRRLASKGCHAVTFSENPEALALPSIHTRHWDALFAAACDEGTVLCLHVGSASRSPAALTSKDAPASVLMNLSPMTSTLSMVELIWADLWGRFPELRFSLTEGDIGWIPYSCGGPSTRTSVTAVDKGELPRRLRRPDGRVPPPLPVLFHQRSHSGETAR